MSLHFVIIPFDHIIPVSYCRCTHITLPHRTTKEITPTLRKHRRHPRLRHPAKTETPPPRPPFSPSPSPHLHNPKYSLPPYHLNPPKKTPQHSH
ncbi:hypothetical protein EX30DRAFT_17586 [Ascodesmis nigricans]|uniref:Uncharacterized protein n=1 Tax=Ascodesmis nigricans TaxID=341454 RepID=A0A4S2N729_9PEZI|nr:hypothetical protein EX30DRAFT_17586 [Ascodesmis nigricans]